MKNTLTSRPAEPGSLLTKYGVVKPRMKFQNQLEAMERDMALARMLRGKISLLTTQAMGPHVEAKKAM